VTTNAITATSAAFFKTPEWLIREFLAEWRHNFSGRRKSRFIVFI